MGEESKKVLQLHLEYVRTRLQMYSKNLGIGTRPNVKGLAREGVINLFLRDNFPSAVEFSTGEVIDENGSRSGLIDIVVQSWLAPRVNLFGDVRLAFVDSVLAAIEVKSELSIEHWSNVSHLKTALDSIAKMKNLKRHALIGGKDEHSTPLSNTPCFVLAYNGPDSDILINRLNDYGTHFGLAQEEYWPEVITVLDKGYYIVKNDGWLSDVSTEGNYTVCLDDTACLTGMYVYLCMLIESWSREHHPIQFLRYFYDLDA